MNVHSTTCNKSISNDAFKEFIGEVNYVDGWFLMNSPMPLMCITASYLLFVLKLGPKFMKSKPKYNLNNVLIFYNIFQVMYSCFLLFIGSRIIIANGLLSSSCFMDTEASRWTITTSIYYYFLAKVSELMDTVFFVLRKNYHQITFLHIYHHTLMMCATWIALKYEPTLSTIFLGTLNSFVHIIMYGYYALSAFPRLTKYLWWKKYITMMQLRMNILHLWVLNVTNCVVMLQFALIILQAAASHIYSGCRTSYTLLLTISLNALLFIFLFSKFYVNAYLDKNKENRKTNVEIKQRNGKSD